MKLEQLLPKEQITDDSSNADFILLFGIYSRDLGKEIIQDTIRLDDDENAVLWAFPLKHLDYKQLYYKVEQEEELLVLLLNYLAHNLDVSVDLPVDDNIEEFKEALKIEHLLKNVGIDKEVFNALNEKIIFSSKPIIVVGDLIYKHKDSKNLLFILASLIVHSNLVLYTQSQENQKLEKLTIPRLARSKNEIKTNDANIFCTKRQDTKPTLVVSKQFAMANNLNGENYVEFVLGNKLFTQVKVSIHQDLTGLIGIFYCKEEGLNHIENLYPFFKVSIKKVNKI